ncbi:MAG: hypothetical protein Q8R76_10380 [Candidatus Omnitrophota bacterium]|nr:hypothetical protein [Candidatus Omnitrophota bacterium]
MLFARKLMIQGLRKQMTLLDRISESLESDITPHDPLRRCYAHEISKVSSNLRALREKKREYGVYLSPEPYTDFT